MTRQCTRLLAALCFLAVMSAQAGPDAAAAAHNQKRPFEVDDVFRLEAGDLGDAWGGAYSFSADGQRFAYTRAKPNIDAPSTAFAGLVGNVERREVWVQLGRRELPINIAAAFGERAGWWCPSWSPDGKRLALLSTAGGQIGLWVWEAASGKLMQISTLQPGSAQGQQFFWISNEQLLYLALPNDARPNNSIMQGTWAAAERGWRNALEGRLSTVSVLESGVSETPPAQALPQLWRLDVSGTSQLMADGVHPAWRVSPDAKQVVFARPLPAVTQTTSARPLVVVPQGWAATATAFEVEVVTTSGKRRSCERCIFRTLSWYTAFRWSPDGKKVAFLASTPADDLEEPSLIIWDLHSDTVVVNKLNGLVTRDSLVEWTAAGNILLYSRKLATTTDPAPRADWWLVTRDGSPKRVTAEMKSVPEYLLPTADHRSHYGIADGKLWQFHGDDGVVKQVTFPGGALIKSVVWPTYYFSWIYNYSNRRDGGTSCCLVVDASNGSQSTQYRVDLQTGHASAMRAPSATSRLVAYSPVSRSAVFVQDDDRGLAVWRSFGDGLTQPLFESNDFLRDVQATKWLRVNYVSLKGQQLHGWLLLPYDYRKGRRYPLLTWVYPGDTADDEPDVRHTISRPNALNMQIAAGHGYAVLFPSMPALPNERTEVDQLTDGVVPAVDEVIRLGIAEPARLFVMGHSFGGFATSALVTQTNRFKAAIAISGMTDLVSAYGTLGGRARYEGVERDLRVADYIKGVRNSPPWEDPEHYVRNSPVLLAAKVETPLMLVHGDLDWVPMSQDEEFFTALRDQGKRAELVRYWGETHVLESPANIRDFWSRAFRWFEQASDGLER